MAKSESISVQIDVEGSLQLDRTEVDVKDCVNVHWDFSNSAYEPNSRDSIGVLEVGDNNSDNCLDWKELGKNSKKFGCIKWKLTEEEFEKHTTAVNFCYFRRDDVLLLKSPILIVINRESQYDIQSHLVSSLTQNIAPINIEVYDVHCTELHWRFDYPNPVLEFHLTHGHKAPSLLHHGQKVTSIVQSMTINPRWTETFRFKALPSDILQIKVQNRARIFRSFWGRVNVPLKQFLKWRGETTLTFSLEKRLPTDSATGTITLSVRNWHLSPAPEGASGQQGSAGHDLASPLSANTARPDLNSVVATNGHPAALSSSAAEPQRRASNGDPTHRIEGVAPFTTVNKLPYPSETCTQRPALLCNASVNPHMLQASPSTMKRRGGFPSKIFSDIEKSESYLCSICLDVCRSPVTCQTGAHLFCLDCLTESLQQNSSCPVCRDPLTTPLPSVFASAQVSALDVVCIHDKCKWKGTCGRLDRHLDTECDCEPIACSGEGSCGALVPRVEMATHQQFFCLQSCPNSKPGAEGSDEDAQNTCDVLLSRNDLVEHLKCHCKLRLTRCPHPSCELSMVFNRMAAHVEICPYVPVSCPQQCEAPNLTRRSLDAHRSDCPNEPVSCVHAPLGCSHVAPRGQIGQHERDIGVHFMALSKAFVQLQQSHELKVHQMEETLQAQASLLEKLQVQVKIFEEGLLVLQPVMVKARAEADAAQAEARVAQARARAEAMADEVMQTLRCYKCPKPAIIFAKNDLEPNRNDSCRVHGFSGSCTSFNHIYFFSGRWGGSFRSKKELFEEIWKDHSTA